jgi:hypothetical protein
MTRNILISFYFAYKRIRLLMTGTTVLPRGFKSLQKWLQVEKSRFSASPILLLESTPHHQASNPHVAKACQHVKFLLSQQLGFRVVQGRPAGAYPTSEDVIKQLEMAARVGAGTVVAVGSGTAMDLAKTLATSVDEILMIPATYGGVLASSTPHALLLDAKEETLVLPHNDNSWNGSEQQQSASCPRTIGLLEPNLMETGNFHDAALATISLLLDAAYRKVLPEETLPKYVDKLLSHDGPDDEYLLYALIKAGQDTSFGLESQDRSIPIALLASLLPTSFADQSTLTFLAGLAPSMYSLTGADAVDPSKLQSAPKLIVANETVADLMALVRTNQSLWRCRDATSRAFLTVLNEHVLLQ